MTSDNDFEMTGGCTEISDDGVDVTDTTTVDNDFLDLSTPLPENRKTVDTPPELAGRPPGPSGTQAGRFQEGDVVYCLDKGNYGHIHKIDEHHQFVTTKHTSRSGNTGTATHQFKRVIYASGTRAATHSPATSCVPQRVAAPWQPFPVDSLPDPLREFVIEQAAALGVDQGYIGPPLIATIASAIGGARTLRIKKDWIAPCALWVLLIAESGGMKSPALKATTRWLRHEEERLSDLFQQDLIDYAKKKTLHDRNMKAWKSSSGKNEVAADPPIEPERAVRNRRIIEDATVEAIAPILATCPAGLLVIRDEASGWLDSMNEYKGKGGDTARWNAMYEGQTLSVDRKGGDTPSIYVRRAIVSVLGGIQPGVLARRMTQDAMESGLLARCMLTMPPRSQKQWVDKEVPQTLIAEMDRLFRDLFNLGMSRDERGHPAPIELTLTSEARQQWADHVNHHGEEGAALVGDDASWWAKLEGVAARVALCVAAVRDPKTRVVDAVDIDAGIAIAGWWANEIDRVRALMLEDETDRARKLLVEVIRRHGGEAEPRDLVAWSRVYRNASSPSEAAQTALMDLAAANLGTITQGPSTRTDSGWKVTFRLSEETGVSAVSTSTGSGDNSDSPSSAVSTTTQINGENGRNAANGTSTADALTADATETQENDVDSAKTQPPLLQEPVSTSAQPSEMHDPRQHPCHACDGRSFRRRDNGPWICERCHPEPAPGRPGAVRVEIPMEQPLLTSGQTTEAGADK